MKQKKVCKFVVVETLNIEWGQIVPKGHMRVKKKCRTHDSPTTTMRARGLTFLHAGVQLGDLDGQALDAVLEGVGAPVKGVGLVKKIPEDILCMFTCTGGEEKQGKRTSRELERKPCQYMKIHLTMCVDYTSNRSDPPWWELSLDGLCPPPLCPRYKASRYKL